MKKESKDIEDLLNLKLVKLVDFILNDKYIRTKLTQLFTYDTQIEKQKKTNYLYINYVDSYYVTYFPINNCKDLLFEAILNYYYNNPKLNSTRWELSENIKGYLEEYKDHFPNLASLKTTDYLNLILSYLFQSEEIFKKFFDTYVEIGAYYYGDELNDGWVNLSDANILVVSENKQTNSNPIKTIRTLNNIAEEVDFEKIIKVNQIINYSNYGFSYHESNNYSLFYIPNEDYYNTVDILYLPLNSFKLLSNTNFCSELEEFIKNNKLKIELYLSRKQA